MTCRLVVSIALVTFASTAPAQMGHALDVAPDSRVGSRKTTSHLMREIMSHQVLFAIVPASRADQKKGVLFSVQSPAFATSEKTPEPRERRLAGSVVWEHRNYCRGTERTLPEGFPMHGPHWQDCAAGTCGCEQ
jgi:hypothetical protein